MQRRADIDQHHIPLRQRLRIRHAMRIGRRFPEQHDAEARPPIEARLAMGGGQEVHHIRRGDARPQRARGGGLDLQRHAHRLAQDRDLMFRLAFAQMAGDGRRGDEAVIRQRCSHPLRHENPRHVIERDGAAGHIRLSQNIGEQRVGVLILLPAPDGAGDGEHGADALHLEGGRQIGQGAARRQHRAHRAFGLAVLEARQPGEVGGAIQP